MRRRLVIRRHYGMNMESKVRKPGVPTPDDLSQLVEAHLATDASDVKNERVG